jgi:hypothetical protein
VFGRLGGGGFVSGRAWAPGGGVILREREQTPK